MPLHHWNFMKNRYPLQSFYAHDELICTESSYPYIFLFKHPNPVQLATNLFLPGGFELARYADSKVTLFVTYIGKILPQQKVKLPKKLNI